MAETVKHTPEPTKTAPAVAVKALEWTDITLAKPYWEADTDLGTYLIQSRKFGTFWWRFNGEFQAAVYGFEEAKAAAQDDYNARRTSAGNITHAMQGVGAGA